MYKPTAKSYFSGAGGMDYGLSLAGINIIQSLEIDKVCIETLKKNFKHKIIDTDIKDITVHEQDKSDIIVGTFPCTKYSTIADIHQTRTGDDLFLHFFRHIAIEKPECYVIENVPGMKKFKVVMESFTKLPDYYVNVLCPLDASCWLPQKRKRLILIGSRKKFSIELPNSIISNLSVKDILEDSPKIHIPDYVYKRINGKYRDKPIICDLNSIAPTCVAHYSKDVSTRMVKDENFKYGVRPFTPLEYARLQGFPDSFKFSGLDNQIYKQVGNAVAIPMAEWIGNHLMDYFN